MSPRTLLRDRLRRGTARGALIAFCFGGLSCEGDGSRGQAPIVQVSTDPRCSPVSGKFPSGFTLLPEVAGRAVVVQFSPPALLHFDIDPLRPLNISPNPVPGFPPGIDGRGIDSDGDGVDDGERLKELGVCGSAGCIPKLGSALALNRDLVLVSASTYDELLFYEPTSAGLVWLQVENPPATPDYDPDDYPLLPAPGETALRTAVSTKTCVYPPDPFGSNGASIASEPLCAPGVPSYLTKFTNEKVRAAGRLFVATANQKTGDLFYPGTVLVYDFHDDERPFRIRPDTEKRMIFTNYFNPTGVTHFTNSYGRELVLVTLTGAISAGGEIRTAGGIDVIDAESRRVVATIPLGTAGPSFGPLAIDPTGRIALMGSATLRNLYAIDLAPLDDSALYQAETEGPVVLDGTAAGFSDARIFHANHPLALPHRSDGPPSSQCPTITNVAINDAGDLAFATDWCDGTLIVVELDLRAPFEIPLSPDRFRVQRSLSIVAPKQAAQLGRLSTPSMVHVRPGRPGVDFTGPDVFFIANEPDGQLCGINVER